MRINGPTLLINTRRWYDQDGRVPRFSARSGYDAPDRFMYSVTSEKDGGVCAIAYARNPDGMCYLTILDRGTDMTGWLARGDDRAIALRMIEERGYPVPSSRTASAV